jgi:hypothetical protein
MVVHRPSTTLLPLNRGLTYKYFAGQSYPTVLAYETLVPSSDEPQLHTFAASEIGLRHSGYGKTYAETQLERTLMRVCRGYQPTYLPLGRTLARRPHPASIFLYIVQGLSQETPCDGGLRQPLSQERASVGRLLSRQPGQEHLYYLRRLCLVRQTHSQTP